MAPTFLQVRLSFLSTLLDEAHDYLHLHLCASVLGRKLFRLPFHRDVPITEARALTIRAFLNHCVQVSAAVTGDSTASSFCWLTGEFSCSAGMLVQR